MSRKAHRLFAVAVGVLMAMSIVGSALADQPPGQLGYEGQPGHQGGYNHSK